MSLKISVFFKISGGPRAVLATRPSLNFFMPIFQNFKALCFFFGGGGFFFWGGGGFFGGVGWGGGGLGGGGFGGGGGLHVCSLRRAPTSQSVTPKNFTGIPLKSSLQSRVLHSP